MFQHGQNNTKVDSSNSWLTVALRIVDPDLILLIMIDFQQQDR